MLNYHLTNLQIQSRSKCFATSFSIKVIITTSRDVTMNYISQYWKQTTKVKMYALRIMKKYIDQLSIQLNSSK